MRRALFAALAAVAVLIVAPATAGADTISLGAGLGLTYNNGPVLDVTAFPTGEAQLLLSVGTSQTCASGDLADHPTCVATSVIAPSTAAQQMNGEAQVSNVGLYFDAESVATPAANGESIVINPYTGKAFEVANGSCSGLLACGQSINLSLYNAGSLPAPIIAAVQFTNSLSLLPAVQAGASSTETGTISGGFGLG